MNTHSFQYTIAYTRYHQKACDPSLHLMYCKLSCGMWSPNYLQNCKSKANHTEITVVYQADYKDYMSIEVSVVFFGLCERILKLIFLNTDFTHNILNIHTTFSSPSKHSPQDKCVSKVLFRSWMYFIQRLGAATWTAGWQ